MIRMIFAGSESFHNYELFKAAADSVIALYPSEQIEIVSGGSDGSDRLALRYARERKLELKVITADLNKYGKHAYTMRDEEMVRYATHCTVLWDVISDKARHLMRLAHRDSRVMNVINCHK